ncbi:uncharacterized protein TRUGW13939_10919 [Talaromyces rugulosus]|uniref:Uncharacterized protein n=1 Tax=Talaromyces rugulosus TaxID=121627 RepID=A0A7H8RCM5_TALRU|nr:uncharacterized protein TRUGW13939_10919 [Talaromyces rugulosus]QKX63748.1 hypothetical protein TRUGW13939_10919 [Talaromyces rugulosus]
MASSRIDSLATTIAESAQELRTLLAQHGMAEPSFSADCPASTVLPPAVDEARNVLLRTACEIQDLLLDPANLLRSYAVHANLVLLHFIQQFNIGQLVPVAGETKTITFAALAEQCGLPDADVHRLVRHAMAMRVFEQVGDNETIESLKRFPSSSDPSQSGFALANNSLTLYDALAQSPARAATFAASKRG